MTTTTNHLRLVKNEEPTVDCDNPFHSDRPNGCPSCTCAQCGKPAPDGVCADCETEIQRDFALDNVRGGMWQEADLEILGMTEDQAKTIYHDRVVWLLAYSHTPETLMEAARVAKERPWEHTRRGQ